MDLVTAIDRRRLLALAAAAATGQLLSGCGSTPAWRSQPFTLGVASGDPTTDGAVLWTRLLPADGELPDGGRRALPLRWEVAHDAAFSQVVRSGEAQALPALGHSVHVEVDGLAPDRWYFYRFLSGGVASPVGRTRTLPLPDARPARLRLAYASCQRWEHGRYAAWGHMLGEQLDAVVFLGDYIYEYPNATAVARGFPGTGWVKTLPQYRERHALHRSEARLQAMHAACPWLVVWDDHEVQNDYAGIHPGDDRPLGMNAVPDFAARRAAAYQAFYEHMPIRASAFARALGAGERATELRLHRGWRFGQLADLLLLDGRQYRDAAACPPSFDPAACPAAQDPARTRLGLAQERWLDAQLAQAGRGWTVLGQQTLFGMRDLQPGPGVRVSADGWDGFPAARRRLLDSLRRNAVANPVFLGGDIHEHWVGHVPADPQRPEGAVAAVEFCGTSITSQARNPGRIPALLAENPQYVFADAQHRGYGVLELSPGRLQATLRGLDDATRDDARLLTLARFVVEPGRRRIERA